MKLKYKFEWIKNNVFWTAKAVQKENNNEHKKSRGLKTVAFFMLSYYVSTPQFRSAWSQLSNTVRSGFANLADKIRSVFVPMANRINRAISRSMDKAIKYIRRYGGYSKYFVAYAANLKGGKTYFPAPPVLSFALAVAYVLARGDVFASFKRTQKN